MKNKAQQLESLLVQMIDAERQRRGMDVYELGRLAWPDRKEGRKIFASLVRGYTSTAVKGKKRGLGMDDFYRLCAVLEVDPVRLFTHAVMETEGSSALEVKMDCGTLKKAGDCRHRLTLLQGKKPRE